MLGRVFCGRQGSASQSTLSLLSASSQNRAVRSFSKGGDDMENTIRNVRPRSLIGVLALVLVAAAIWAATALAAGGSSSSSGSTSSGDTTAASTQSEAPAAEDCPDRDSGSEDGADTSL
jgi:hypothetical protein